jgi:hypothetical protein
VRKQDTPTAASAHRSHAITGASTNKTNQNRR